MANYIGILWAAITILTFPMFRSANRAILFTVFSGTLFLPESLPTPLVIGPITLAKYTLVCLSLLIGVLIYHFNAIAFWKPSLLDLPIVIWCICPIPTAFTNNPPPDGGLEIRDAIYQVVDQIIKYGIPYFAGRIWFNTAESLREFSHWFVICAIIYVPLCLFEVRMSPQLHKLVYGYSQHSFAQTIRFGGYRPMVFMSHGLVLALFMSCATLISLSVDRASERLSLNKSTVRKRIYLNVISLTLLFVMILLKSSGALLLTMTGILMVALTYTTKTRIWLVILYIVFPLYVGMRTTQLMTGETIVSAIREDLDAERAQSIEFRLDNENLMINKAHQQLWFGWGGWGRGKTIVGEDSDMPINAISDGLWIIIFSTYGLVGITSYGLFIAMPFVRYMLDSDQDDWLTAAQNPRLIFTIVIGLWLIDCLPNACAIPVYYLIVGALMQKSAGTTQPLRSGPSTPGTLSIYPVAVRQYGSNFDTRRHR